MINITVPDLITVFQANLNHRAIPLRGYVSSSPVRSGQHGDAFTGDDSQGAIAIGHGVGRKYVAREAGVSRATVYRVVPGGKDRLVQVAFCHEAGRLFHAMDAELSAAETLEDLLVTGIRGLLLVADVQDVLRTLIRDEPELVLPHFAFHRLDRIFDLADTLARPHLSRFLAPEDVRPAAELLARVVLSFAFRPTPWVDPHEPATVRRLVRTYLVPALTSPSEPEPSLSDRTTDPAQEST